MTIGSEYSTQKLDQYYTALNPDILDALPHDANQFLDVGCASGELGKHIKRRFPRCTVHGLEREPRAIEQARSVLDTVFSVDLDKPLPALAGPYDCIICGDVLEHLIDPWTVLRDLADKLEPGGHIVASIPNIRHYKVLKDLVFKGRFQYQESGILDSTHLRFFTLIEMRRLFSSAGLEITFIKPKIRGKNLLVQALDNISFGRLEGLRAIQYTLVAQKPASPDVLHTRQSRE